MSISSVEPDQRAYPVAIGLGYIVVAGYLVVTLWAIQRTSFNVWGGIVLVPVITLPTIFILRALRRHDPWFARVAAAAFFFRLAGTVARYTVIYGVYNDSGDAGDYHAAGDRISDLLRSFEGDLQAGKIPGTGFMRLLTGVVYVVIGPSELGGFFFFGWLSFLGTLLMARAFAAAMPDGHRRYSVLVLFAPSMLFWASGTTKEAWMLLSIGLSAYGAARLLTHRRGGAVLLAIGLTGTAFMRPHITLAIFVSALIAFVIRRPAQRTATSPIVKVVGLLLLLLGGALLVSRVEQFFNVDTLDPDAVRTILSDTATRNADDGSSFEAVQAEGPADLPRAFVTVLFRPFPHEAANGLALVTSVEGVALAVLMLWSLRRIWRAIRLMPRHPYAVMAGVFVLLFVFTFSSLGNFGLLARQRVQLLPFLFVLLSVDAPMRARLREEAASAAEPAPLERV